MALRIQRPGVRRWLSAALLASLVAMPAAGAVPSVAPFAPDAWMVAAIPSAPAITEETVLIAGDIASCSSDGDRRTAALIDALPGLVMTAGDNIDPAGAWGSFRDCYDPTWGRFLDRTGPVPGNHDWMDPGAAGYFGYLGSPAGPPGSGY